MENTIWIFGIAKYRWSHIKGESKENIVFAGRKEHTHTHTHSGTKQSTTCPSLIQKGFLRIMLKEVDNCTV